MIGDILLMVTCISVPFGLAALILWLRDRGGVTGLVIRKTLGVVSLTIGLFILGWVVYNMISPTRQFRTNFVGLFQLGSPMAMVGLGWFWLTRKPQ